MGMRTHKDGEDRRGEERERRGRGEGETWVICSGCGRSRKGEVEVEDKMNKHDEDQDRRRERRTEQKKGHKPKQSPLQSWMLSIASSMTKTGKTTFLHYQMFLIF